jgi:hypothetical protein
MRITRAIIAVMASVLVTLAVGSAAVASGDPGMFHDGVELVQR